jgi:formylglycine-generating enzyme required for sulfatase activity
MSNKEESTSAKVEGSGAIAQDGGVAAGEGGLAVGGDVHGPAFVAHEGAQVTINYQGAEVAIPSLEAVQRHRAALRQQLAADALKRWGGMSVYIQEEGATLPIQASPYQAGQLGPRENLLQTLHAADRLLVLGEPGTGKTVALERLAWELCDGQDPTIPILIRLFQYAGTPLVEWVRTFLQRTGQLRLDDERALTAFLKEGDVHCVFLFDGLNEVAPLYRDRLIDEMVRWMAAYPRHSVVVTSRSQDELWRRLRDDVEQALVVQPINDSQAQVYLVAYLGELGATLYGQLDQRLQQLARTPLILWLIKEAGAAEEDIPGNRGQLYARFVERMLRRDTTRRMDTEIPVRVKKAALTDLAFDLGQREELSCKREYAVSVTAKRLGDDRADQVIGACARHGLLAGEDKVWFSPHQTMQEHFAALALQTLVEREKSLSWWDRTRRRLVRGREKGLADLAADGRWMEAFVQLAGLMDGADSLVREVARVNPWLAWWCVQEGRDVQDETREMVANQSVKMLESEQVRDRRRGVVTLAKVRRERSAEPLLRAAADTDAEVVGSALQALMEIGETVRPVVAKSLAGTDKRLWKGSIRYLATRLDDPLCGKVPEQAWEVVTGLPMVWVPPGPFTMGSGDDDPDADDCEKPQRQVTLSGYWICRYPMTAGHYRAFVDYSGYGYEDVSGLFRLMPWRLRERWGLRYRFDDVSGWFGPPDRPIGNVTWYDAIAYCRWLREQNGLPVTLPSEAEWEKAARGTDGRLYPWGDQLPTDELCSFDYHVFDTTPVGQYSPQGDSPYGCADMAGNVWEWTRSRYDEYTYEPTDGREDLGADRNVPRVLRGGSWLDPRWCTRCAARHWHPPDLKRVDYGFRIVVASTP